METSQNIPKVNWADALKGVLLRAVSVLVNYLLLFSEAFDSFSRSLIAGIAVSILTTAPLSLMLFFSRAGNEQAAAN